MFIACLAILASVAQSLTYIQSSSEGVPIYCTETGWSLTKNSTSYQSYNTVAGSS